MMRLNGWQRLYVCFLVFALAPMAYIEALKTKPDSLTENEFLEILPESTVQLMTRNGVKKHISSRSSSSNLGMIDWSKVEIVSEIKSIEFVDKNGFVYLLQLPVTVPLDELKTIETSGIEVLAADYSRRMWVKILYEVVPKYLSIAVALVLAAYAFVWVKKGFSEVKK